MQLVTADEFANCLRKFSLPADGRLALAVSGGPDSMALAHLVKQWAVANDHPSPRAFIVDHALRSESAAEAITVKARLEALGIEADILCWDHTEITSRLHETARKARYKLLLAACRKHKINCLLFAHQREDQAETILMRFAKGTGIDGLAGISADTMQDDVRILRPLLDIEKQRLMATCDAHKVAYVTDPSNEAEKFARGRLRHVMPLLAGEGLSADRLVDLGRRAGEARDALQHYTSAFLLDASHQDECGTIFIDRKKLNDVPRAVARRALSFALQSVHQDDYPPQHAALTSLLNTIQGKDPLAARTLNGCLVTEHQNNLMIIRELSAITDYKNIRAGQSTSWDGRWHVSLSTEADQDLYVVKALGNPPHDILDRLSPDLRHKIPQGRVRATLPALWFGDRPVLIPFFHNKNKVEARLLRKWGV